MKADSAPVVQDRSELVQVFRSLQHPPSIYSFANSACGSFYLSSFRFIFTLEKTVRGRRTGMFAFQGTNRIAEPAVFEDAPDAVPVARSAVRSAEYQAHWRPRRKPVRQVVRGLVCSQEMNVQ